MIPLITHQMAHVQIVHTEVREPISDGEPFAKHHQSGQRQSLSASLPVLGIATKISEESLIVDSIPYMRAVLLPKLCTILTQGVWIYIIHAVVLYQDAIVTIGIRITYHGLYLSLGTVIITFIVAPIRTFIYIAVQIDGLCSPVCLRNMNANNLCSIYVHYLDIVVKKDVLIHLVTVEGIPEVCNNLAWLVHTNYLESLANILLLQIFIHTKQNQSAYGIGKSRIRLPN